MLYSIRGRVLLAILLLGPLVFAFQNCAPFAALQAESSAANSGTDETVAPAKPLPIMNLSEKVFVAFSAYAVDPFNPQIAYGQSHATGVISRTTDGGVTWVDLCQAPLVFKILIDPASGKAYANGSYTGVYGIENRQGQLCPVLKTPGSAKLANDGRLYAASYNGPLQTSADGGTTWQNVNDPFSPPSKITTNSAELLDWFYQESVADDTDSNALLIAIGAGTVGQIFYPPATTYTGPVDPLLARVSGTITTVVSHWVDQYPTTPPAGVPPIKDPVKSNNLYFIRAAKVSTDGGATLRNMTVAETFNVLGRDGATYRWSYNSTTGNLDVLRASAFGSNDWTLFCTVGVQYEFASLPSGAVACHKSGDTNIRFTMDSGKTWNTIARQEAPEAIAIDSFSSSGSRLYAANFYHLFRSDDGGLNWGVAKSFDSLPNYPGQARVIANPTNADDAFLFLQNASSPVQSTADGFQSLNKISVQNVTQSAFGFDGHSAMLFAGTLVSSRDGNGVWTSKAGDTTIGATTGAPLAQYPGHSAFLSSSDVNRALYVTDLSYGFAEYSFATNSESDANSRLPFNSPGGMTAIKRDDGSVHFYVVSQEGALAESTDGGTTFTQISAPFRTGNVNGPLILSANQNSNQQFAIATYKGSSLWVTHDGGANWKAISLDKSCDIQDVVMSARGWLIACPSHPPQLISPN